MDQEFLNLLVGYQRAYAAAQAAREKLELFHKHQLSVLAKATRAEQLMWQTRRWQIPDDEWKLTDEIANAMHLQTGIEIQILKWIRDHEFSLGP